MDIATNIIMLVPVILAVALIIGVIRRNITERSAGDPVNISGAIPAVIVLMVAVLVIVAMGNASSPYVYDEEEGELTIQQNVPQLDVQPWDSYASSVRSLVIKDGVSVASGAFDTMTGLEQITIGERSTIASGAFGVSFEDPFGASVAPSDLDGYTYAGFGDGVLFQCDPTIYTYSSDGKDLVGLAADSSDAVNIVLPKSNGTKMLISVSSYALRNNTAIENLVPAPGCAIMSIGILGFSGCTSLTAAKLPSTVRTMDASVFKDDTALETALLPEGMDAISEYTFSGCTSLTDFSMPSTVTSLKYRCFYGCTSLTSIDIPSGVDVIQSEAFSGCTGITSFALPAVSTSVAYAAFSGCTGVTQVSFDAGFDPATLTAGWCQNWTFYASDATTVIDKSSASNFAGHTFTGTASALVMQS